MAKKVRKAVFPVAGMGTRVLPATKAMPKEMLTVVDKPIIQYAVEEAMAAGIEEFIFVTGHGKNAIENHFDRSPELERSLEARGKTAELRQITEGFPGEGQVFYTRQREPLGLGHAVYCAKALIGDEPFAVLLPDDIMVANGNPLKDMIDIYERTGTPVTLVADVPRDKTSRYGILNPGGEKMDGRTIRAHGFVEKPKPEDAPSTYANVGRYVLSPKIFDYLALKEKGAGGEIQLTDAMVKLLADEGFYGYLLDGRRFDCGDKAGLVIANIALALQRPELAGDIRGYLKTLA